MRIGERPDPGADRARRLLRTARAVVGRRAVHVLLVCAVLVVVAGVGAFIGAGYSAFAIAAEDPELANPTLATLTGMLRSVGVLPQDALLVFSGIKNVNVGVPAQALRGALSHPERVELDIAELDFQRLAYERERALARGLWVPSEEDYVPVTVRYANQTLHGKARLKGDWPDHWFGEQWSLRFKLDGADRLDHMREFALQSPRTRNYLAEWLFQQTLAREGLSGLSYRFVDVTINGKPMGTYAVEEAFDDGITWYNREPGGPLLRFSDTVFWESREAGKALPDPAHTVVLDAFGGNSTGEGYGRAETDAALSLLERWRTREVPASQAFDVDRTARYFALSDLLGNLHGNIFHNIRFYYNPVTARLEPVGHDANAGVTIPAIKGTSTDPYYRLFFDDPVLNERYLAELDRISADGYLEGLFAELEPGIQENLEFIWRDQPFYFLPRAPYFANRELIRDTLHPYRAVTAYVNGTGAVIDVGASQPLPVEVTALVADGVRAVPVEGPVRLPGKVPRQPMTFETVAFSVPDRAAWNASAFQVECRVLGTSEVRLEPVVSRERLPGTGEAGSWARLAPNTGRFGFAVTDDANRTVDILPGAHVLNETMVVPEGYVLRCGPGTSIDLAGGSAIVALGRLDWQGTESAPVTIASSDGSGGGVLVLRAGAPSVLENVRLANLSGTDANPGGGTALTFLGSPVEFRRLAVDGTGTAPLLRLVESPFNGTGCAFAGGGGPAVSAEFSKGNLTDLLVRDGAGIVSTGSVVALERARFANISGTAVLAERESTLYGESVGCDTVGTAVEAATGSTATVHDLVVGRAGTVGRAGESTAGFGPGRLVLAGVTHGAVATPYVDEGDGSIVVDGRSVAG